jgi:hypothetical protein
MEAKLCGPEADKKQVQMSTSASVEKMGKIRDNTRRAGYPSQAVSTSFYLSNAVIFNRSISNMAWLKSAQWIWTPTYLEEENRPGRYFLFRKAFQWTGQAEGELPVHVSADSRYRLFVNGQRVSFGPCKGYPERWHYETVDILPHLVEGENVISARVLRYSPTTAGSSSIISTELPGFMLHGDFEVSTNLRLERAMNLIVR